MYVVYYRMDANVIDMRTFKDGNELSDWLMCAVKDEPIVIVGIYDKDEQYSKVVKDYAKFVEKFHTGQIVNA